MKITIDSADLIELLNEAVKYGGDASGPYCENSMGLKEKMIEIFDGKLELVFDEHHKFSSPDGNIHIWRNHGTLIKNIVDKKGDRL